MPLKTHQDEQPSINLTPMIDIVFLLIIFFMVGTKFTELERNMELEVPQVSDVGALTSAPQQQVVNVYGDGRIALDKEFVSLEELKSRLTQTRSQYADLGVLVRGDAQGPLQNVTTVLDVVRQAGISDMGISVRLAKNER